MDVRVSGPVYATVTKLYVLVANVERSEQDRRFLHLSGFEAEHLSFRIQLATRLRYQMGDAATSRNEFGAQECRGAAGRIHEIRTELENLADCHQYS